MTTRIEEPQRYTAGEAGRNRVRLYPRARNGKLLLDYCDRSGKRQRKTLTHWDWERAKVEADAMAADLASGEPIRGPLTLRALFDNYEREKTRKKSPAKQLHDKRARALFEKCWGGHTIVADLDLTDWDRFIEQRRSGALRPPKSRHNRSGVRNRVIETDLRFVLAVCNWAESVRDLGRPRNPFKGFPVPTEANPERPTVTEAEYKSLQDAAKGLGPQVALYLLLAHETGHRCTAVARLKWSDVDIADTQQASATWRAEFDKMGREHVTELSPRAAEALQRERRSNPRIGDGWLFPSPTEPTQPVRRDLLRDWWQKLEKRAALPRVSGRGWHSLRRKFATDLRSLDITNLKRAGGWRDHNTILKCYQQPDTDTIRAALAERGRKQAIG